MNDTELVWKWRLAVIHILIALLFKMRYPEWGGEFDADGFKRNMQDVDSYARMVEADIVARGW